MDKKEDNLLFETIIQQHKGILWKVAQTYCQSEEERQDLIQEMMIQIWKSLLRYNHSVALSTWLYRIALNVAISFYRKNVTRQTINIPLNAHHSAIQEAESTEKEEQLHLLKQFISELNELDKALILLYLEDKSHAEISEIMGLSITNVGTKLSRIREKLKQKFSQFNS